MRKNRLIIPALLTFLSMQGYAQELNDSITSGKPAKYSDEVVEIGYHKAQRLEESTSSISTVYNEDFNKRSAKNIANSLFGYGTGLTTLQGSGRFLHRRIHHVRRRGDHRGLREGASGARTERR